jgi:hypothetical protein
MSKQFICFIATICLITVVAFQPVASAQRNSVDAAVQRSIPLLQKTDVTFLKKSGCVSCHNNSLTAMTVSLARKKGFAVDETVAADQVKAVAKYIADWRERIIQGVGIPGLQDTMSYILIGLGSEKFSQNASTDALARFIQTRQQPDGHWPIRAQRPPLEASNVTVTATCLRALQLYAPEEESVLSRLAVDKAAGWLAQTKPRDNEEHTFRLLGLIWSNASKDILKEAAVNLLSLQKSDGGWSQLPDMKSDAYATGQALVALHEAGVAAQEPAYQRGVEFLLNTQLSDGSWLVKTRAVPIQPYFESDFPHGDDQWISVAATNWATMALIHTK